ncbi:MAG: prepilin peptidase [Phenylobacterium sp.]|uniref:A24 family peptidase n=1 Tax=Phenylobacterium sp. TaxID=1871053 RepID=UPI001A48936C|nr:prepilin peptidase [Phenylobacterium sp.]MBL8556880.1 prepilin peptidase [Phenylobacterium sp.]
MLPPLVVTALVLALPALALAAAVKDATTFTIPNGIPLALLVLFPVAALAVGLPWAAFGWHVAVGAAVLVAGMAMFALRWVGGGDAKLLAAAALWVGWPGLLTLGLGAALAGGALAAFLILARSAPLRPVLLMGPRWMTRLAEPGEGVPYGVAIAAGTLWALPATPFAASLGL